MTEIDHAALQIEKRSLNTPRLSRLSTAATIFLSSVLLFLIQPIIAKRLLPVFGGAAAVWITCLVFFQCILLAGYLYAHVVIRFLRPWAGVAVHTGVLLFTTLLIFQPEGRLPAGVLAHPAYECLKALSRDIGLPYFVLSSTTPLVQAWYSRMTRGLPYRLFALSNFGSLLSLIAYPSVLERLLDISAQLAIWRGAYLIFVLICGFVAIRTLRYGREETRDLPACQSEKWNWLPAFTWIGLSACSSALLLGVTNVLCQNIAAIPFLWIAPLSLYLITFILCFDHEGIFRPAYYRMPLPIALAVLTWAAGNVNANLWVTIGLCLAGLFTVCMFCHGQLSMLKPASRHLTAFYLSVSIGGALGGIFAGLVAPALFTDFYELEIAIAACLVFTLRFLFHYRSKMFLALCGLTVLLSHQIVERFDAGERIFRGRNFYGAISVRDSGSADPVRVRTLVHGRTVHGGQLLDASRELDEPTFYYGPESGVAIAIHRSISEQRIGVVGLGVGTLAAYGKSGDDYRFYEINPMVAEVARSKFTFLSDSIAHTEIVLGDARLSLERESDKHFDTLVLDAFSGDSIPVHLLTDEAFQCYFRHLKDDGVIAVHVSNQYVDFRPVVANVATRYGRTAVLVQSPAKADRAISLASWILVTKDQVFLEELQKSRAGEVVQPNGRRLWTDRFSDVSGLLRSWR